MLKSKKHLGEDFTSHYQDPHNVLDETLPNFIKRKAPKKGREKERRDKDQSPGKANKPKRGRPQEGGKGTTKNHRILHPPAA